MQNTQQLNTAINNANAAMHALRMRMLNYNTVSSFTHTLNAQAYTQYLQLVLISFYFSTQQTQLATLAKLQQQLNAQQQAS